MVRIENGEAYLHTFEMNDFDIGKSNNQEWRFGQIDKAICRRLKQNIRSERDPLEPEIPEWNVNLYLSIALPLAPSMKDIPHQRFSEQIL